MQALNIINSVDQRSKTAFLDLSKEAVAYRRKGKLARPEFELNQLDGKGEFEKIGAMPPTPKENNTRSEQEEDDRADGDPAARTGTDQRKRAPFQGGDGGILGNPLKDGDTQRRSLNLAGGTDLQRNGGDFAVSCPHRQHDEADLLTTV